MRYQYLSAWSSEALKYPRYSNEDSLSDALATLRNSKEEKHYYRKIYYEKIVKSSFIVKTLRMV